MADPRRDLTAAYGLLDEETQGGIVAQIRYGQLLLETPQGKLEVPATRIVDDLIALGFPPEERRAALWHDYEVLGAYREVEFLVATGANSITKLFLKAAREGASGWLNVDVLSSMGRVRLVGHRRIVAWDMEAVAAWALYEAILGGKYREVRDCALCGVPFLSTGFSRYCRRRSPSSTGDRLGQSCLDVAKVRDHRSRQRSDGMIQSFCHSGDLGG